MGMSCYKDYWGTGCEIVITRRLNWLTKEFIGRVLW